MTSNPRQALVWSTMVLSLSLLVGGACLIAKNTPRFPVVPTVFPPPSAPLLPDATSELVAGVGIVEAAGENISLGSPLSGIVVTVPVAVGDRVEAGAPLIEKRRASPPV